ncbi:hypothetical protein Misp06_03610 [Microbulbifer sp. NBRC 101763]
MNGGARNFKASATTEEAAMEMAKEIAKSKDARFYSWLQIFDTDSGVFIEYSVKDGVLIGRGGVDNYLRA